MLICHFSYILIISFAIKYDISKISSFEKANQFYNKYKNKFKINDEIQQNTKHSSIYDKLEINIMDRITLDSTVSLLEDLFLIVSDEYNEVLIYGKLCEDPDKTKTYYLTASTEEICYDKIRKHKSNNYKLIVVSENKDNIYEISIQLIFSQIKESDKTLCIDFGTCNTVAGIYDSETQYGGVYDHDGFSFVDHVDFLNQSKTKTCIYPTIVYISEVNKEDNTFKCEFGLKAKKILVDNEYNPPGSIFFEIKRWIVSYDEKEAICGPDGAVIEVSRKDIICKYLMHIIDESNKYYKCVFKKIHFSAPVKLKRLFLNFIEENLFPDKTYDCNYILDEKNSPKKIKVEICKEDETLDESVAIVYQNIRNRFLYKSDENKELANSIEKKRILIIDCGGGTTDMASCNYILSKKGEKQNLKIDVISENGDSNFGGNNITYRIFQLLKIKLVENYINKKFDINIPDDSINVIDEEKKPDSIYAEFNKIYSECEKIIPTDFGNNDEDSLALLPDEKKKMKRNFYYLWDLAEKIKIQFFNLSRDLAAINFDRKEQREILVQKDDDLYFFIKKDGEKRLQKMEGIPNIEINIKTIEKLIKPDIYFLLYKLFVNTNKYYNSDDIKVKFDDYNYPEFPSFS